MILTVVAFARRSDQPKFKIKKASQAIWINPGGDATFNLECIIDLTEVPPESPLNEVVILIDGRVAPESIVQENDLFLNANFCDYLYDGKYERKSESFVKLLVAPDVYQFIKIASIHHIEVTPQEHYTRIRIFFSENLRKERSDVCGDLVKYAGFRIRYTIRKFARKIKKHIYSEAIYTIDLRPYDTKVIRELTTREELVDLELLYYWVVLPQGFFVTAYAPQLHQIRNLELDPWRNVYQKLEEGSICYAWKLVSPSVARRLHLDFKEPAFEPKWTFWLALLAMISFLITLLRFFFKI